VSPTIQAESPTSVTTHGTPQAIASPTAFGKPSPREEDVAISSAFCTAAMSERAPAQINFPFSPSDSPSASICAA